MAIRTKQRRWIPRMRRGMRIVAGASAIALALSVAAIQSAEAQTFTVLHDFTGNPDGASAQAGLVRDASGNIYGTTANGGASNDGAVFKIDRSGTETVLYAFTGSPDGALPLAGLIRDTTGNLYGTTYYGGTYNYGTVFKVDSTGTESVLYSFRGMPDAQYPYAGLHQDAAGNLYGTTNAGGAFNRGAVFKVDSSGAVRVLYSFDGTDGSTPFAGLISDKSGNLYGTSLDGGPYASGNVFKLTRSSGGWTESILYTFTGGRNGKYPYAGVILDSSGNVYGTTNRGGAHGGGTVFELKPSTKGAWNINVLYSFTGNNDGGIPQGGVIFDKSGNLYGTGSGGGYYQEGVVFKLNPPQEKGRWKESVLYDFTGGTDGASPVAGVIRDSKGDLYGTTPSGGSGGFGTVWKLTP
jgi:uncharacterized repeat protein (TIGR03803 family)